MNNSDLVFRQSLPLDVKVKMTLARIEEAYNHWNGSVYVAFSGGKDSTVLLHLVRSLYPRIPAVFCDTGLEFPEVRKFAISQESVIVLKPKMPFQEVLEKYGYPVISKEISAKIYRWRNTKSEKEKGVLEHGRPGKFKFGRLALKWRFLIDAPFKISDVCCDVIKKRPSKKYEKETGNYPFMGMMAGDSRLRKTNYLKFGCNAFEKTRPSSNPLSFWTEKDIWEYIKQNNIEISPIYEMGYDRTGCVFCLFGWHKEDKMAKLAQTHPKLHKYCMEKLGMAEVVDWLKGYKVNFGG